MKETKHAYTVEVAAPGLSKEDFNVRVDEDDNLVITLEKKEEKKDETVMNYDLYHAPVIKKGGVYDQGNGRCDDVLKLLKELSSQHKKLDSFPYDEIKLHTKTSL